MRKFLFLMLVLALSINAQTKNTKKSNLKSENDKMNYALGYNYGAMLKDSGIKINAEIFLDGFLLGMKGNTPVDSKQKNKYKDQDKQGSYSLGISYGELLKDGGLAINKNIYLQGCKDGLSNKTKLLKEEEFEEIVNAAVTKITNNQMEKMKMNSPEYKEGAAFLEENKKKEGVITTASGLQYKVLVSGGKNQKPGPTDTVKTHYEGKLINGNIFDSSFKRNEPISFPLNRVIKGWTEGLQLMNVGDKFEFYIPYDLAYGANGAGGVIPPFATLIFVVELLDIKK